MLKGGVDKFQWGEAKGGITIFDLNLVGVGVGTLEKTMSHPPEGEKPSITVN